MTLTRSREHRANFVQTRRAASCAALFPNGVRGPSCGFGIMLRSRNYNMRQLRTSASGKVGKHRKIAKNRLINFV